ncbi:Co/Zn/Cd efflux system component [Arthrobacter sp. GAS37]|uniref:cation diffusion facilitator family transporter n=1 Tax=Arthrobacter sp. GAS37 TaxID=3156261 RepID=UPI0038358B4F
MTTSSLSSPSFLRRVVLSRRIRLFAAATITYNVIEAIAALWAGGIADSSALIGFGLDSLIEVGSAAALSWQFSAKDPERREHLTLRIIAVSFFALAAFVTLDSLRSLAGGGEAQHSVPGIVIAALSLAIMPVLSWLQRRAGRELGSRTAVADSKQTLLCTYLSAVLLAGLVLNSAFGWWWADAGAAMVIALMAFREGINAWRGDSCCVVPHAGNRRLAFDRDADHGREPVQPDTANRDATDVEPGSSAETTDVCCPECSTETARRESPAPRQSGRPTPP